MLLSAEHLRGFHIHADDGDIGKADTFLFDDVMWTVRYLVADTGNWLADRLVLISPVDVYNPNWRDKALPVDLTRDQVIDSPQIDADQPVSLAIETELSKHYGWPTYWTRQLLTERGVDGTDRQPAVERHHRLRSTHEVAGYAVVAADGKIGTLDDLIIDTEAWKVRYLVIDTDGGKVLVSPDWVEEINWSQHRVHLHLSRDKVRMSPRYDPTEPVNRRYEQQWYDYHGRPVESSGG